ncbi:MAG: 2-oxo acid dehydrogenase subunit E2 [Chloroflexi bacterium]|nr:2-oxo acid dehydrogenase subunit E2 [Chloroflexota bacterium]
MPYAEIKIPDEMGEVDEWVVVTWLKQVGDRVQKDEVLLVLQAAKVSYDYPAPADGKVAEILAAQGEVVNKQQVLARLEVETSPPAETAPAGEQTASPSPAGAPESPRRAGGALVSPLARRVARENQVDLAQVTGSGPGGRISDKDVLAYIAARQAHPAVEEETPGPAGQPAAQEIPFTGARALIARRMLESMQSMAQLTLHTEADVTDLVALREQLKQHDPLTYSDLIVRACALALEQHPHVNATLDGERIRILPEIHIGLAVALKDGLIVPVILNANRLSLKEIAAARERLVERARSGKITPAEYSGGTFTVTNLGTYDIDGFTPIINPPEAAILGVGRIREKVVVHQGKVAQRAMLTLSLTIDHRIVDGAPGAEFLKTIKQLLEAPAQLT